MRRKYADCQREDGNCANCSLVNYGRDCHNRTITNLEYYRHCENLTQAQVAQKADVDIRLIQKIESGECLASNLTARNFLAIADALDIDPHRLL